MKEYIKSLNILSDKELNIIDSLLEIRNIDKGDFLIRQGQISKEIALSKKEHYDLIL